MQDGVPVMQVVLLVCVVHRPVEVLMGVDPGAFLGVAQRMPLGVVDQGQILVYLGDCLGLLFLGMHLCQVQCLYNLHLPIWNHLKRVIFRY